MTSAKRGRRAKRTPSRQEISLPDLTQVDLTGTLCGALGMEIVEASAAGGIATMPVQGNTQPAGILHGGASIALAETIASVCALFHARAQHGPDSQAVGVNVTATHHRSVRNGDVTAMCRVQHLGAQLQTYLVEVRDRRGHLLCTATVSTMAMPPREN
ncbi:hotdog fold thioesterase [Dermabacteraceae bacterium P9123]